MVVVHVWVSCTGVCFCPKDDIIVLLVTNVYIADRLVHAIRLSLSILYENNDNCGVADTSPPAKSRVFGVKPAIWLNLTLLARD